MIKYCKDKWEENRARLEKALREDKTLHDCDYVHLLQLVVRNILNQGEDAFSQWASEDITVADNGDYSGTMMFLIPESTYEPSEYEYLLTFVDYGSCSGCDTLLGIHACGSEITDQQIKEYMDLCKDLVMNMVKPYNYGWRHEDKFDIVEDG